MKELERELKEAKEKEKEVSVIIIKIPALG